MSWKLWKEPLERAAEEFQNGYQKGLNLSDWNSAATNFNQAFELYSKVADHANAAISRALCAFAQALANPLNDQCWSSAAAALAGTGLSEINVTSNVPVKDLVQECQLKATEIQVRRIDNGINRAVNLEQTAKQYLVFGSKNLMIPLLLEKQQVTGTSKAHIIISEASVLRGDAEIGTDPKHAAEFYRMAAIHMKTAGNIQTAQSLSGKAEDFSATALCYFCGREVIGREINFVYMKSQVTKFIENQNTSKILPCTSGNMVVACKGCHSAITIAADDIARAYYNQVQAQIQQLESEIARLNSRVNGLQMRR